MKYASLHRTYNHIVQRRFVKYIYRIAGILRLVGTMDVCIIFLITLRPRWGFFICFQNIDLDAVSFFSLQSKSIHKLLQIHLLSFDIDR